MPLDRIVILVAGGALCLAGSYVVVMVIAQSDAAGWREFAQWIKPRRIGQVFRRWWLIGVGLLIHDRISRKDAVRRALEEEELRAVGRQLEQPPLEHRGFSEALFRGLQRDARRITLKPRLVVKPDAQDEPVRIVSGRRRRER